MNIGYLLDIFPKTSETFVLKEIAGLSASNTIRVFAMSSQGGVVPDNMQVTYFKKRFMKEGLYSLKAGLKSELLSRSAKEHYYRMVAQYFSTFRSDVDILHRHFATNSIVHYLARELEVPYTVTTHAWDLFAKDRYKHLDKVLRNAKRIVTISEFNKRFMMENLNLREEDIHVVRMGIDPEKFRPSRTKGDTGRFLSVGRLVEKKGFNYAIWAFKRLAKRYPDSKYIIVGSGPEEPRLMKMIEDLKLEDRVKIISGISNRELLEEYKRAGTFILPCIRAKDGDMDGIPVVLMEAMAMQMMVISTDISGIGELITNGTTGLLVKPGDGNGLSRAMEKVLSGRVDVDIISKEARRSVIKGFNLNDQVAAMDRIFKEVLSGDI